MTGDESTSSAGEDERKLFVGGLPHETKHEDVKEHFGKFGAVEKVKLMSDQATGRFKGFGFVVFEEVSAYAAALAEPEQEILGRMATVKRATTKVKQGKIYVGKLPVEGIPDEDLRAHFEQFGTVVEVVRPVDKTKNDEPKQFAFVTFEKEEIARKLVKLGEDVLNNHKITIKPVITKDPGMGGGMMGAQRPHPPAPHAWGGYGQQAYGGYGGYGGGAGYGAPQGAAPYGGGAPQGYGGYGGAAPAPPPPAQPSGAGVPSLASFNPYDMASYGGGKERASTGAGARHAPY